MPPWQMNEQKAIMPNEIIAPSGLVNRRPGRTAKGESFRRKKADAINAATASNAVIKKCQPTARPCAIKIVPANAATSPATLHMP